MKTSNIILLVAFLSLLSSCSREKDVPADKVYKTIHYSATASSSNVSKATLNPSNQYIFEDTDRLFVCDTGSGGDNLYGVLTLISGAGERTAYFEGDLACAEDFELLPTTPISVTLVGASGTDLIHTVSGGKLTGSSYPAGECAATLAEAIQKFSNFTCSTTFDATTFTLSQQSTFLVCDVRMNTTDLPGGTDVTASLMNGSSSLWEGTITSASTGSMSRLSFVIPFEGDSITLNDASLACSWTGGAGSHTFDDLADGLLAANNYYTVSRSTIFYDGFRIKAKENGTTMTFKYTDGSIQFSQDSGVTWANYTGQTFNLNKDDEICFKGTRADCDCIGTTQLFNADKVCYIAGKITSLLADPTQFAAYAFRSAFSNGTCEDKVTTPDAVYWVDINPDDPLILPSFTSNECYREMFRNCTSLSSVPDLPAEITAPGCYWNMFRKCIGLQTANINLAATKMTADCCRELFRQCSNLTSVPIFSASTLATRCYQQMLSDCSSLGTVVCLATDISATACLQNWMTNIKSTGTLFKADGMNAFSPGNNGIPSGWIVTNYGASTP